MGMKEVEICRLIHSDRTPECQMYLREKDGDRIFPIIIHEHEMSEIHRKVHGMVARRPMTHDLLASVIRAAGLSLESVEVTELKDEVFHARMNFRSDDDRTFSVDARPSDAVAVATGIGAPLFASEDILDEIGVVEGEGPADAGL